MEKGGNNITMRDNDNSGLVEDRNELKSNLAYQSLICINFERQQSVPSPPLLLLAVKVLHCKNAI